MAPRLQGAPSREALTLCFAIDLILQGRVAESADCLVQRLKSIELVSQGAAWQIAQRLVVLPPERPVLSTRSEAKEAIREQKEESKTKSEASQTRGKGEGWRSTSWTERGGDANRKGKDSKGRGKKGKQKERSKDDGRVYEPPAEGAPFEGELIEVEPGGGLEVLPEFLTLERPVDAEARSTGVADVRPGIPATSLPSPSERLNVVALEKECMNPQHCTTSWTTDAWQS